MSLQPPVSHSLQNPNGCDDHVMVIRATLITLSLELIDHIYVEISFLATRTPSPALHQNISRPNRRTRFKPRHQRPPRRSCDGALVVTRKWPCNEMRVHQEPLP